MEHNRANSPQSFDPYAPPQADVRGRRYVVAATELPPYGSVYSILHDLTEADLKRFYGLDHFYDPIPWLGFVPQWVSVLAVTFGVVFVAVWSWTESLWQGLGGGVVAAGFMFVTTYLRTTTLRQTARDSGFLTRRQLTISATGIRVSYPPSPELRQTELEDPRELQERAIAKQPNLRLTGLPVANHPWGEFRRVEFIRGYLVLWKEGRSRLVVPERVFHSQDEAEAFAQAIAGWIATTG